MASGSLDSNALKASGNLAFACMASCLGHSAPHLVHPALHSPRRYGASYLRLMRANFLRSWRLQLRSKLFM